jgi:hypothetical protein
MDLVSCPLDIASAKDIELKFHSDNVELSFKYLKTGVPILQKLGQNETLETVFIIKTGYQTGFLA